MTIAALASYGPSLVRFRGPLLAAMVRAGHNVVASAPETDPDIARDLESMGVRYLSLPLSRRGLNPLADLAYAVRVRRLLQQEDVDVSFFYTIKPVIFGSLAARASGIKAVYSLITGLGYAFAGHSTTSRLLSLLASRLYAAALRCNRRVFFQNPDDQRLFVDKGLVSPSKTRVVNGSGIDLSHFPQQSPYIGPPVFLMMARLLRAKGVSEYLDAARQIKNAFPFCEFRLAGGMEQGPDALTQRELEPLLEGSIVRHLGWVPDVRPLLQECTAYVLPSYREGTPRSVLEALASGRPVITTDAPGCRETVVEGFNGFLVPVRNSEALAVAIKRFLQEPTLAHVMGRNSRKLAEDKYDVSAINKFMLENMGLSSCEAAELRLIPDAKLSHG